MGSDDQFDDLISSLAGFHRTWLVYLGVELGLFERLREAGAAGLTAASLADSSGCVVPAVDAWLWAADAHELVTLHDGRATVDEEVAVVLLDQARPEFLGGQFVHSVVASLDWDGMLGFFRTGQPIAERPDRYRASIERLTVQDIAVFFSEALAALPQLVADLSRGGRVVDVHCGGARWLIAMARRFPALELVGVEFQPDSVLRARANVDGAGLADRIQIHQADVTKPDKIAAYDLAYFQYALHQLVDPVASLPGGVGGAPSWRPDHRPGLAPAVQPRGVPDRHGELIAGVQLDELYQGTALVTRERFVAWFAEAELPEPALIDLPSGASLLVAERPA